MNDESAAARRRRAARLFGELLPEQTSDDRPDEADRADTSRDRQIADDVPPHHGG